MSTTTTAPQDTVVANAVQYCYQRDDDHQRGQLAAVAIHCAPISHYHRVPVHLAGIESNLYMAIREEELKRRYWISNPICLKGNLKGLMGFDMCEGKT